MNEIEYYDLTTNKNGGVINNADKKSRNFVFFIANFFPNDNCRPLMREALEQGKKILGNDRPEVIEYQNDYNQLLQAMRSDSLKSNVRY